MKIAEVVLPLPIDKSFSYSVPEGLESGVKTGVRVRVPFGSRKMVGFVIKTVDSRQSLVDSKKLKEIGEVIDAEPVINQEMLKLSRWISSYYFCPLGKVLNSVVPVRTETSKITCYAEQALPLHRAAVETQKLTGSMQESFFIPTPEQNQAIEFIKKHIDEGKFGVALLEGTPGTGKTEVYLQCIAHTLDREKKVLILIAEISLTLSLLEELKNRFGSEKISVFHGGLSRKIHDLEWERIRKGEADIVIGTRSAIFSPLNKLGLIVIDKEEDYSFKEEKEPRYHARDVAVKRARYNNAFVILESSVPAVESYYNSTVGKYKIFKFSTIFKRGGAPAIEIANRKKSDSKGQPYSVISPTLEKAIRDTLSSGEKTILFLNRRGFATSLLCLECGGGFYCPNCQVPLVLHYPPLMVCHYCNYRISAPDICPNCGGVKLRSFGTGTQRVAEEVKKLFPDAVVSRFDIDTRSQKGSSRHILDKFRTGKIDVLVGTQMIPREGVENVSLLGIISIDAMLNLPDFRSAERVFQVLTRMMGLLERRVVIQTYNPDHYIFSGLSSHNYHEFYKNEIKMRKDLGYPPFTNIVLLSIYGKSEVKCSKVAESLEQSLKNYKEERKYEIEVLGPAPAPIPKLRGKYRYQLMMKGKKKVLDKCLQYIFKERSHGLSRGERISIDIDPLRML